jgi:predicted nucleic-acid-binding Zn-ribbon protein
MNLMDDLRNCPKCGSEFIDIDSSWEMQVSEIKCLDCGYSIQKHWPENWLTLLWNIIPRLRKGIKEAV